MIEFDFKKENNKKNIQIFPTQDVVLKTKVFSDTKLKRINLALKQANFKAKEGEIISIYGEEEPILVVGIGKEVTQRTFEKVGGLLIPHMKGKDFSYIVAGTFGIDAEKEAVYVATGMALRGYQFDKYLTKEKSEKSNDMPKKVTFILNETGKSKTLFKKILPILESVHMARDLSAEPANKLTPVLFAKRIKELEKTGLEIEILSLKDLKDKKFGMLLSVAQGSANEPKVAIMKWIGNPKKKSFDIGLVGKGVTFDSGGISLKPGAGMGDMKQDMTGAAVVVSSMRAFALRAVKSNIIGIVGLVENMPSGTASRPGDIVTSLSGQTVEILNTDAEGRLVLGDCLWYMQSKYNVTKIIDLATLTGAVMAALGEEYAGLFSNDDTFAVCINEAGKIVNEEVWRLPMNKEYDKMLNSDIADMKNIGGRLAGGSTAACFLSRFIKKGTTWAHLDIAGVDKYEKTRPTTPKGATGWGVRLLNQLVE